MDLKIYNIGFLGVNTYLLTDIDAKESIIIDLGGDYTPIINDVEMMGSKIKFILNTHGHFDHIIGEGEFQKKYPQIPIYMHKKDTFHLDKMQEEILMWGFNEKASEIKMEFIDEDSELYIGTHKIKVIHTPGHSAGGLCFYTDDKLFSGDTLFQRSIGRTDFYDCDYDTLINSIKSKLLILEDSTNVYPGHGPKTTIREEKIYNTYLK